MSHLFRHILGALNKIGIKDHKEYGKGNWFGNSSMDAINIFEYVTFNLSDLISSIEVRYQNGVEKEVQSDKFDSIEPKPRTIGSQGYGRCYGLDLFSDNLSLFYAQVRLKKDLEMFFDIPHHFYTNSRPRLIANTKERLYVQVTYEILKINYGHNCKKYSPSYTGSFDECEKIDMEEKIMKQLNCTVPFLMKPGNMCVGKIAEKASELYEEYFESESPNCPHPCHKMVSTFGMPKHQPENISRKVKARLYFNNVVKTTEDFVSYDLLR